MFDDIRLPDDIEAGAKGGPSFSTTIATYGNGREKRNANWSRQKMVYDIAYGIQNAPDYEAVLAFFYARQGRAIGFRFKDWGDYSVTGAPLGTADGVSAAFQLVRPYVDASRPFSRTVTRPVAGTVVAYVNGQPASLVIDGQPMGIVTLANVPPAGAAITADFEFDVPVRFDVDELDMTFPTAEAAVVSSIKLIELIE